MAIKYNHKDANRCQPAGEYPATLVEVTEEQAKSGRDMYKCSFRVYGQTFESTLIERIVMPEFVWKLKKLATAFGADAEFESDSFDPAKYVNCNCIIVLDIQSNEEYGDQNRVKGFKPKAGGVTRSAPARAQAQQNVTVVDDDIPFK